MWKGGIRSTVYDDEEGEDEIDFSLMEMELGSHINQASGEGIPVVLSQHQVDGYRISSHARLVLDGEEPYIKAGYLDDFRPNYEPVIEGSSFDLHMLAMEAYAEGEPCDELIMRAFLAPPPRVVFESPVQPEASLVNILEKIALRQIQGDLCLLNPSIGTVWRAIDEGKYFSVAYTIGSQNDANRKRFESTFEQLLLDQKHNYYPQLRQQDVDVTTHYFCGMSGVHKWVKYGSGFDPNIFDPQFVAASVTSMEEIEGGVRLRYWRKDYETQREWLNHPHYYRYSASSYVARVGRDYKDSNYYQNELTAYLDRFYYCTTSLVDVGRLPFSPTPCGKVFFPVSQPFRVWWEGERAYPMYQYVKAGQRYLVWVDMGYSFYSSKSFLQEVAGTLAIPLWDMCKVPVAEYVLYPLSSVPTVVASEVMQPYTMGQDDKVLYSDTVVGINRGYECTACGVWQIGLFVDGKTTCFQCQNPGRELLIGVGPEVSQADILNINRSPGRVVRMSVGGVCVLLLGHAIAPINDHQAVPDLIIEEIPYLFKKNGSVVQLVQGLENQEVSYVFWGKVEDYPEQPYSLRYGEWARYQAIMYRGQAQWQRACGTKKRRRRKNLLVEPQPRFLFRKAMADWHDTTTQLTLAAVPLVDWIASIMPRTLSSAKGVDDGKSEVPVEECEWL